MNLKRLHKRRLITRPQRLASSACVAGRDRPMIARVLAISLFVSGWPIIFSPLPAHAEGASAVYIEEVAWAGSPLSTADEWIELVNLGDATSSIAGWSLHGVGSSDRVIFFPDGAEIGPGSTYLIANYEETHENSSLLGPVNLATSTVSLSNSALLIELREANGAIADRAGDGSTPFFGSTTGTLIRNATSSGDLPDAWGLATTSTGFKDGQTIFGSPSICDLCVVPTAEIEIPLNFPVVTTSTTIEAAPEAATTTGTTVTINETTATSTSATTTVEIVIATSTSSSPVPEPVPIPQTPSPPLTIVLNEAVSNPLSGPEWIELRIMDNAATKIDRDLELWDAAGKIASIPKDTLITVPAFHLVVLSSSKLNNGGDELTLKEKSGAMIGTTSIPGLDKGESWSRNTNYEWQITNILTPGFENVFPEAPIESPDEPEQTAPVSTQQVAVDTPQTTDSASESTGEDENLNDSIQEVMASAIAANNLAVTDTDETTTPTKTSKGKAKTQPIPYPFDSMFDPNLHEAYVRVTGSVASVTRLLGATHAFTLHSEDGRGLIVYLPDHLNVPPFGSVVSVQGTLKASHDGPEIRMKKTDIWRTLKEEILPVPRMIDLLAPGGEDAWSLVVLEGKVTEVKTTSFMLQTEDGIDIRVNVPNAVGFRTKRLKKGDVLRVTGLVDLRKDDAALLPRNADEIVLLSHSEMTLAPIVKQDASRFPDWAPFGAAAGAIAATGIAKRVRDIVKRRKLQLLAAKAEMSSG